MLESVADIGIGLADERPSRIRRSRVKQNPESRTSPSTQRPPGRREQLGDELAPAGAEVIDDHHFDAAAAERSARLLPMKPAPPVIQTRFMSVYEREAGGDASS